MIALADPLALAWLLALAPVAAAARWAARRRRAADAAFGGPPALRPPRRAWRRRARGALLAAAIALAALAAARPQWGVEERPLTRLGIDVAVALDISRSMTARDAAPSRGEAAAAGLADMLAHLRGDRVGLVTFAGEAFPRSPLTLDLDALAQLIARARNEAPLVVRGTDLGGALDAALDLLDVEDAAATQAVVLVSDGEDVGDGAASALERAAGLGVRVYAVAVGTEEGAALPPRGAGDGEGGEAASGPVSRADPGALRRLAEATGGDLRPLDAIAGLAVEFQRLRRSAFDESTNAAPVDRFQWFVAAALALLLAQALLAEGARRPRLPAALGGAAGAASLLPLALLAAACADAAYEDVRRGNEAYAEGAYGDALAAYREAAARFPEDAGTPPEIDYDIGNALHRLERYEEATAASRAAMATAEDPALWARAAYAAGNHAFRRGDLEAAREAYVGVLLRDPGDRDAKHNLELALRLLATPPADAAPPSAGSGGQGGAEDDGEGSEDGGAGERPPGEGEDDRPPDGGGNGEAGEEGDRPPSGGGEAPPDGEDGAAAPGGGAAEPGPRTLDDARAELSEALLRLGDEALTPEQATAILDLVRTANSLDALDAEAAPRGGGLPDR